VPYKNFQQFQMFLQRTSPIGYVLIIVYPMSALLSARMRLLNGFLCILPKFMFKDPFVMHEYRRNRWISLTTPSDSAFYWPKGGKCVVFYI